MENYIIATEEICKSAFNEYQLKRFYEKLLEVDSINQNLTKYQFELMIYVKEHWFKIVTKVGDKFYSAFEIKGKYFLAEELLRKDEVRLQELPKLGLVDDLEKPNFIGKFTDKKVLEWINYCDTCYNILENEWQTRNKILQDFFKKIDGQPFKFSKSYDGSKIVGGWIEKNGLEYSFSIDKMHIYEKIQLSTKVNKDYDTFLKMSDNGFGK